MSFNRKRNPPIEQGGQLYDCDRCGYTTHRRDTLVQGGLRVCLKYCKDNLDNQLGRR